MANINKIRLSGQTYDIQDSNAQPLLSAGTGIDITDNVISATGGGGGTVDSAITSGSTNAVAGGAVYDKFDEVEQVTARALNELNEEVSEKQDTLVSGTNIKTINNTSILGSGNIDIQGGGTTYTAGRGIDITNDTISVSLPISAGTGINSIAEGEGTTASGYSSHAEGSDSIASGDSSHAEGLGTIASGDSSHAEGYQTQAKANSSHAEGYYTIANNKSEHASGQFNVSSSASTTFGDSGNTLFSVGNGTSSSARHNAFEIRQNGDIYANNGTSDVKLQDYLQIKVVKLTQSAYDALSPNYDSNTLYVIVN